MLKDEANIISVIFLLYYLFCCHVDIHKKYRDIVLILSCCFLSIIVGCRSMEWPDTTIYADSFKYTPTIPEYSVSDTPFGYGEVGFYFLASLIRTFTSNCTLYFIVISGITFIFLYKSFRRYSIYPLVGLCVYIARFFLSRNMMQIRAALAIAVIVYALRYVAERNFKKYFIYIVIGSLLHYSILSALPFYWLNKIRYSKKTMFLIISITFTVSAFLSPLVTNTISTFIEGDMTMYYGYVKEGSGYSTGKGLSNPMIYYQSVVLFIYTFRERTLKNLVPYYYTIRNGYLYSTVILILLSPFLVLSGRLSTIFATLEIFIIPAFLTGFKSLMKAIIALCIGVAITCFFYLNITSI